MEILISPISPEEAQAALEGGADIVDVKNPAEGSLGASFPWIIREIVNLAKTYNIRTSATLGDLPFKPGTASLAAMAVASLGVDYIKLGVQGPATVDDVAAMMSKVVRAVYEINSKATVVAAGYADYQRFGGPSPATLVEGAVKGNCRFVMLDTGVKDGLRLGDHLSPDQLREFVAQAKAAHCRVALAGSVGWEELPLMRELGVDLVGVRGAVCLNRDRTLAIDPQLVRRFTADAKKLPEVALSAQN